MELELQTPLYCIAHRGGCGHGGENSLQAIAHSLSLGVDAIEIDVWQVKGQLLVTHDRRLGNTVPGKGLLLAHKPKYLRSLPLRGGGHIPTLLQVLDLVKDQALLNIELKGPGCVDKVCETLETYVRDCGASFENYLISSFDQHQLYSAQQLLPQVKRGVLIEGLPLDLAACCKPHHAYAFSPSVNFVSQALVDDARRQGLKTWVYTVNYKEDMRHLAAMGVDGVFTDYPEKVLALNASIDKT